MVRVTAASMGPPAVGIILLVTLLTSCAVIDGLSESDSSSPEPSPDSGRMLAADSGAMLAMDSGSMLAMDSGSMPAADSGSMPARDSGPMTAPDSGPMIAPDSGPTPAPIVGDYVLIPAGSFMLGSPPSEPGRDDDEAQHTVTISRPFFIKTTEVTQDEWISVMGVGFSYFSSCGGNCPVESVSWLQAIAYLNRLSTAVRLQECYPNGDGSAFIGLNCEGYRLPTEAEWEYAARAGTTTAYWAGVEEKDLAQVGWYLGNSRSVTHPVALNDANPWGLYDVHGNVW